MSQRKFEVVRCHLKCETKIPYSGFGSSNSKSSLGTGLILHVNGAQVAECPIPGASGSYKAMWVDISNRILEQDNHIRIESRCFRMFSRPESCVKGHLEIWLDYAIHLVEVVSPEELPLDLEDGKFASFYKEYVLPQALLFA